MLHLHLGYGQLNTWPGKNSKFKFFGWKDWLEFEFLKFPVKKF
jgi:hypothetical protein